MINNLSIAYYRKLKDLNFDFSPFINVISGTNGTCKSSLLHIISNSFKSVNKTCSWVNDKKCLDVIKKINKVINPKVESLTRGDKKYNDPARGRKGTLFTVKYFDGSSLDFRRHNSELHNRYAIKPPYKKGTSDTLPCCPVIYLGLSRLLPYGEFQNDDEIKEIKESLPLIYQQEIVNIYKQLTGLTISFTSSQKMGDIKIRSDFSSDHDGIDSNTISAGEDNLFILITALVSLKYYFESIKRNNPVESILLIDELDATLHPSLQFKILDLFSKYSHDYKIQIFFTTHSLSLIEYALDKKHNVVYLIDNVTSVIKLESPDIYKIKMYLYSVTKNDIYLNKVIPIFTEDEEARLFLNILFDYYTEKNRETFAKIRNRFYFVNANIGAENLINIFEDTYLLKSTMQAICILDGDKRSKKDLDKHIIVLPGGESPEKLIMHYSIQLYDNDDNFWTDETILNLGYIKINYRDNILPDINSIDEKIEELKAQNKSTKGVERELRKDVFNKHKLFFELLFKHWVTNDENTEQVESFFRDLYIMFKKVAEFHGISSNEWQIA
ncbi:AAA family ATPase [Acetivibrio clariflavus]|uniref:ATP-dependent nuclease n=1 Tax=Acetivibrio clariflavus TaxID=288965 RepID=UPI0031F4D359